VTEEQNFVDLVWHELEFREGISFTYALYDARSGYLGCAYLYPMGRRTELSEELLKHDVDVSWWVTPDAYERGYYIKLHAPLRHWLAEGFPFDEPYYSNGFYSYIVWFAPLALAAVMGAHTGQAPVSGARPTRAARWRLPHP
jgi:hypothetical protein